MHRPEYSRDPSTIAPGPNEFIDSLLGVPWFRNVGLSDARDADVVRIRSWDDWPGPECGWCEWFFRWPSVVKQQIEQDETSRKIELEAMWNHIEQAVLRLAASNVPEFDETQDCYHPQTTAVWSAAFSSSLIGWHILLGRPVPERLAADWYWYQSGHWPCDYAEEPPGFEDESAIYVPACKLLVY